MPGPRGSPPSRRLPRLAGRRVPQQPARRKNCRSGCRLRFAWARGSSASPRPAACPASAKFESHRAPPRRERLCSLLPRVRLPPSPTSWTSIISGSRGATSTIRLSRRRRRRASHPDDYQYGFQDDYYDQNQQEAAYWQDPTEFRNCSSGRRRRSFDSRGAGSITASSRSPAGHIAVCR